MTALGETLVWWFIGQCDLLVVGSLTFAGLWAVGVPLANTLAVIAALFNSLRRPCSEPCSGLVD